MCIAHGHAHERGKVHGRMVDATTYRTLPRVPLLGSALALRPCYTFAVLLSFGFSTTVPFHTPNVPLPPSGICHRRRTRRRSRVGNHAELAVEDGAQGDPCYVPAAARSRARAHAYAHE